MRCSASRVLFVFFCLLFCCVSGFAQGGLRVAEPDVRARILADRVDVEFPVENLGRSAVAAAVVLELIDPQATVQSALSRQSNLPPGRTVLRLSLPQVAAQRAALSPRDMLWFRLRYSVSVREPSGAAARGTLSVGEAAKELFELSVMAPEVVAEGRRSTIHVRATHPVSLRPVEGVTVRGAIDLDLIGDENKPLLTSEAKTDRDGFATLNFTLPAKLATHDDEDDELDIKVTGKLGSETEDADGELHLSRYSKILLSTDKPMYQPGQTLHARLLVFDQDHKAAAGQGVTIKVLDPDNSLMFRATPVTSRFGVAFADWAIPENLRLGTYEVSATVGEGGPRIPIRNEPVKISRYDLPTFSVSAKPDRAYYLPGQNAEIEVGADYLSGKPVQRGQVRVVQETGRRWNFADQKWEIEESGSYQGDTDAQGHFVAHVDLEKAQQELADASGDRFRDLNFTAYFTDASTGRTEQRRFDVRVTTNPIHIYMVSGQGGHLGGLPMEFYLSTDYADGTPAECEIEIGWIDPGGQLHADGSPAPNYVRTVRTNRYGVAKVTALAIPAAATSGEWSLGFRARDRQGRTGVFSDRVWGGTEHDLRVSTNKTLYPPEEPIFVDLTSTDPEAVAVVEAMHDSKVIASRIVRLRRGHGSVVFTANSEFQNEVSIAAFEMGATNEEVRDPLIGYRNIYFPRNHELHVDVLASKATYRPGEEASATIRVAGADGSEKQAALGLVVLDKAVEERVRTDSDFDGDAGFLHFRDRGPDDAELNGVRIRDLDRTDLTKPLPPGFELAAEALLQTFGTFANIFHSDGVDSDLQAIFAGELKPALLPVREALDLNYRRKQEYPRNEADLNDELLAAGIRLGTITDPWGTAFRPRVGTTRDRDTLEFVSAGPDKKFGTADDFVAGEMHWEYFQPIASAIQRALDGFHQRTGGFIRDMSHLEAEVKPLGIDLATLVDRWGHPYRFEFGVRETSFTVKITSAGPDGRFSSDRQFSADDFSVGTLEVDYFSATLARIDAALNKFFQATGEFPQSTERLSDSLAAAGISWGDLRDPWGHPYYATFRQQAIFADRVNVQSYESYVAGGGARTQLVPVTRDLNFIYLRSAGADGVPGNADDFSVGSFARTVMEHARDNPAGGPVASPGQFSGSNGGVSGVVTDLTGGAISGAIVTTKYEALGISIETTTDADGKYELRNVPPGLYAIQFTSTGFRELTITRVPVKASTMTKLDVTLSVGESNEMVMVSASSPSVETTMSAVSARVSPKTPATAPPQAMTPRLREYFPETLLWRPDLVTDSSGRARLKFPLADNITTWKLSAIASTQSGEIGTVEKEIRAFQPFFVEHDPPKVLTVGDEIDLPVVLRNFLDRGVRVTTDLKPESWFTALGPMQVKSSVAPNDYAVAEFRFRAAAPTKEGKQRITTTGATAGDSIERTVSVRPNGEERIGTASQVFRSSTAMEIRVPADVLPGAIQATVKIYPDLNAHVLESIEAILERPYGCAEQTISSAYPNLLLLQYAQHSPGARPEDVARAKRYVQLGRDRLSAYRAFGGGITYWGRGNPDPALTAYALKFLNDTAEFLGPDDGWSQETLDWLLKAQQADGRWIAPSWDGKEDARRTAILTAYVARILATEKMAAPAEGEAAHKSKTVPAAVGHALDYLERQVNAYDEPYLIASYVLAAMGAGQHTRADQSLARLRQLEHREGDASWSLETNTPFYGWGLAGRVETTALVLQALHAAGGGSETEALESRGLLFLLRNQDRLGIWYSTQATINVLDALRVLTAGASANPGGDSAKAARQATILVDGRQVLTLDLPSAGRLTSPLIADVSRFISPGTHRIEVKREADASQASVQTLIDYYVPWTPIAAPENIRPADQSPDALRLRVEYDKISLKTGEEVRCNVEAERIGFRGYGMMLAEIGLPPGADVDRDSLEKAAQDSGWDLNHYDVLPDRVVLYLWPQAGGTKISFSFRPRFGMKALAPASTLYDYYNPEAHAVVQPVEFRVAR